MSKFYEVRCTASAEIVELWRVQADNEDQAIEAIEEGEGEFIRQCSSDEERDRRDWLACEIENYEYQALGQFYRVQAAAPDMLAALVAIVEDADSTGCDGCAVISAQFIAQAEAAIAKSRGEA